MSKPRIHVDDIGTRYAVRVQVDCVDQELASGVLIFQAPGSTDLITVSATVESTADTNPVINGTLAYTRTIGDSLNSCDGVWRIQARAVLPSGATLHTDWIEFAIAPNLPTRCDGC